MPPSCAGNRAVFLVVAVQLPRPKSLRPLRSSVEKFLCHDCLLRPMNLRKDLHRRSQRSQRSRNAPVVRWESRGISCCSGSIAAPQIFASFEIFCGKIPLPRLPPQADEPAEGFAQKITKITKESECPGGALGIARYFLL